MAWQVKTKYTGAASGQSVLKADDGTSGNEVQTLFYQCNFLHFTKLLKRPYFT